MSAILTVRMDKVNLDNELDNYIARNKLGSRIAESSSLVQPGIWEHVMKCQ